MADAAKGVDATDVDRDKGVEEENATNGDNVLESVKRDSVDPACPSCKILKDKLAKVEANKSEVIILKKENASLQKKNKEKDDEIELLKTNLKRVDLEECLDAKFEEVHKSLGSMADQLGDLSLSMTSVVSSGKENKKRVQEVSNKMGESLKKLTKIKDDLHKPSLEDIDKRVKDVESDVKKVKKKAGEMEVRMKDGVEENKKILEEVISLGKSAKPTVEITDENFKLIYQKLPASDDVLLIGDRILDMLKLRMPDVVFDLLPSSKIITNRQAKCSELVMMDSFGPMLSELTSNTQTLVLSFGSDDLMQDPSLCTTEQYQWVDDTRRDDRNEKVIRNVVQRMNEVFVKITNDFPDLRIIYVAPPPSRREEKIFANFREEIKKLPVIENLIYLDMESVLGEEDWEMKNDVAGTLSWEANRIVMNQIYKAIFPEYKGTFCTTCHGIHTYYCPGSNRINVKPAPPRVDKNQCFFCWETGHKGYACPVKINLRKQNVYCPHCGAAPEALPHQPDWCPFRYSICKVCDQAGHKTEVHHNPLTVKKVFDRIKYNLVVKDQRDQTDTDDVNPSKKRKAAGTLDGK